MFMEPVEVPKSVTDEHEQAAPANPQSFWYFWVLLFMEYFFGIPFVAVPSLLKEQPSRFKAHGGFFVIMTIASVSLAVVASGILVVASFVLERWMKDIHYTILKSIGLFSALLAPPSITCVVVLPMGKLTWIAYSILCLIFVGILFLYNFLWKQTCLYQPNQQNFYNRFHWINFLGFLGPLSITCVRFLPNALEWAAVPIITVCFLPLVVVVVDLWRKHSNIQQDKSSHMQDSEQSPC